MQVIYTSTLAADQKGILVKKLLTNDAFTVVFRPPQGVPSSTTNEEVDFSVLSSHTTNSKQRSSVGSRRAIEEIVDDQQQRDFAKISQWDSPIDDSFSRYRFRYFIVISVHLNIANTKMSLAVTDESSWKLPKSYIDIRVLGSVLFLCITPWHLGDVSYCVYQ